MKWTKASEKPTIAKVSELHWRWTDTQKSIKEIIEITEDRASVPFGFPMRGSKVVDLSEIEWLDEDETEPAQPPSSTPSQTRGGEEPEKSKNGLIKCAQWLAYCLEIGFSKTELDALENLFWTYRDGNGKLKKSKSKK